MTTTSLSYIRSACDRCGFVHDCHSGEHRLWGTLNAQGNDGGPGFPHGYKADLCPLCYRAFKSWWRETASWETAS